MIQSACLIISAEGFSEEGYGTFEKETSVATLTATCKKPIRIVSDGITLTSDGGSIDGTGHNGIYLAEVKNITIKGLSIQNYKMGIYCRKTEHVQIEQVTFQKCTYGIAFEQSRSLNIRACTFYDTYQESISGSSGYEIIIEGNHFGLYLCGIELNRCEQILISSNQCVDNDKNVAEFVACKNIVFMENQILYGAGGISLSSCQGEVRISSNQFSHLRKEGIIVYDTSKFILEQNTIDNINEAAIVINSSKNGLLDGNILSNCRVGVELEFFSSGNRLRNNQITSCRYICLQLDGSSNEVGSTNQIECI